MTWPARITIVEVGPRDGLQSEPRPVSTAAKVAFIDALADAGLRVIEATSFVSPRVVPQLADAAEVLAGIRRRASVRYPVLVPNETGLERALAAGAHEIAIFGSASETYSRKNLGRSRDDALAMFRPVVARAKAQRLRVRGYLSMVIADPWEGPIAPAVVVDAARRFLELGVDELSLGDTTGVGTVAEVRALLGAFLAGGVPVGAIGVHFHDTYGQALSNVLAALELGVTTVDASAGGLGGSTVLPGASGNLATEDLLWACAGLGIETGVDVRAVAKAARALVPELGHDLPGRVARALASS